MSAAVKVLSTRSGHVRFPACIPVTTFGGKYPLDELIRPYLARLASAVMVSFHYARQMTEKPRLPLLIDSGGFASLFTGATIKRESGLGILEVKTDDGMDRLEPRTVLEFQEQHADVAFTLDFPVPPGMPAIEARRRLDLTIANAHWALANRRRTDMPLYACVQGWDADSVRACCRAYAGAKFDGVAVGGLVPRAKDLTAVLKIVEVVRFEFGDRLPLHVFGLGKPSIIDALFKAGVDSVDSSSYVKLAAEGRLWADPSYSLSDPSPLERLHLALCNLAAATNCTLPLSASNITFRTHAVALPRSDLSAHIDQGHE